MLRRPLICNRIHPLDGVGAAAMTETVVSLLGKLRQEQNNYLRHLLSEVSECLNRDDQVA